MELHCTPRSGQLRSMWQDPADGGRRTQLEPLLRRLGLLAWCCGVCYSAALHSCSHALVALWSLKLGRNSSFSLSIGAEHFQRRHIACIAPFDSRWTIASSDTTKTHTVDREAKNRLCSCQSTNGEWLGSRLDFRYTFQTFGAASVRPHALIDSHVPTSRNISQDR